MSFEGATAVSRVDEGRYDAEIQSGWDIADNANGGYLLAIAARAGTAATGRPDPISITAHYLSPGKPGPLTVDTEVLKSGKRFATASATLSGDRPVLATLGSYGDVSDAEGPLRIDRSIPEMPDPDECIAVEPTDTFPPPFMGRIELRLHPEDAGFATGDRSGTPRVRGWFRLRDDEPMDSVALLQATDAFPPTIFNADLPVAWTPTLELTAHVRARPAPGWLRCAFTTRFITGGFLEEDGEIWDSIGRLVAQSRQLALVPRG
ncbi:MAG: thioesterase family protein [Actinomycetota bacterium]